jgi:hypothetical protein
VVIWGLKSDNNCTYRHIQRHLFTIFKKIGKEVIWCDDNCDNNKYITLNNLIFSYNLSCENLQYNDKNYYVLLNTPTNIHEKYNNKNFLYLRVYGEVSIDKDSEMWGKTVFFDKKNKILYQTWGTDLLPEEFMPPIYNNSKNVYWVGSIWNDSNNSGNKTNIEKLKKSLIKNGLLFSHIFNVSDEENIQFIRRSRIAPSIGGEAQVERGMITCRLWKNISYGQLGVTNLIKTIEVFDNGIICDKNINYIIEKGLSISEKEYKNGILFQQDIVSKNYTYINWIYNICVSFNNF